LHGGKSGFDGFDDTVDMARSMAAGDRGADRTAPGMANHDNERGVEVFDGVFDTADRVVIEDVARVAEDEEIAKALVEKELGGDARVGAGEHDRERLLAGGELGATVRGLVRMAGLAGDEAGVTGQEALEGVGWGGFRFRPGGLRPRGER